MCLNTLNTIPNLVTFLILGEIHHITRHTRARLSTRNSSGARIEMPQGLWQRNVMNAAAISIILIGISIIVKFVPVHVLPVKVAPHHHRGRRGCLLLCGGSSRQTGRGQGAAQAVCTLWGQGGVEKGVTIITQRKPKHCFVLVTS